MFTRDFYCVNRGTAITAELFLIRSLSPKKSSFPPKYSFNDFCSFWDNISQIYAYLPQVRAPAMKKGFVMLCTLIRMPLAPKKMRPEFFIVSWYTSKYLNNTNTASLRPAGKDIACLRLLKHVGLEGVNHQQQIWTLFNTSAKKKFVFIRTESKEERKRATTDVNIAVSSLPFSLPSSAASFYPDLDFLSIGSLQVYLFHIISVYFLNYF